MTNALERLTAGTQALAEVSNAKEAWELVRTAEAARRYAKMRNLGHEAVNYARHVFDLVTAQAERRRDILVPCHHFRTG
jgi:hypothetical protein